MPARRALIVGIDHYENLENISGCVRDAERMKEVLDTHEGGDPNFFCRVLTSEKNRPVTEADLRKALIDLFKKNSTDIFLFYFSGHGIKTKMGTYLAPSNARKHNEGVSMLDLLYLTQGTKAEEIVIILDSCHSGAAGGFTINNQVFLQNGVSILTSSHPDEASKATANGGTFTELVYDALKGGAADVLGEVNIADVYAYAHKILRNDDQRPMLKSYVSQLNYLRRNKPKVPKQILRKLIDYFDHPKLELPLTPDYEPELEPHDEVKEAIFKDLQTLRRVNLVEPVGADHMYHAAIHSKSCRLTPSGRYYWELAKRGAI